MVAQEVQLLCGFDAFGDYPEPQAMRHGDDCLGNRRIVGVSWNIPDERTVYLHAVYRETLEVTQ